MDVGELHRLVDDLVDDDARTALVAVRRMFADLAPELEERSVRQARSEGLNWAIIGRLLGRSRQALHRRFGHVERADVRPLRTDAATAMATRERVRARAISRY